MFNAMIETLKANPRKIVFTEGHDARILEATDRLVKGGFLTPILVGNVDEVKANAAKGGFNIEGVEIIDPATYPEMDKMVDKMVELRKGKMSAEDCRKALSKGNYFGTMLVKMGYADSLLGGATYSTADTIRPALQLVKTKKGAHLVSSCFILDRDCGEEGLKRIAMGDCAVNIDYTDTVDKATGEVKVSAASKLAEVAVETAKTAKLFGIDPKVAVLSFSTKGSEFQTFLSKPFTPPWQMTGSPSNFSFALSLYSTPSRVNFPPSILLPKRPMTGPKNLSLPVSKVRMSPHPCTTSSILPLRSGTLILTTRQP